MFSGIEWDLVWRVCIYGQLSVFIVLTLLMISVYATSFIISRITE
jgi:hypothetical protein